jgi:hypothetical protein
VDALSPLIGYTISTPGTVIQNRLVSDSLNVNAANVTIRNCVINAGWFGIDVHAAGSGLLVEDCTIIGGLNCGILVGSGLSTMIRRCNLYGGEDGIKVAGHAVTVRDCYIHDLNKKEDSHNDGIQCSSGTSLTFYNNWIESPDTSCIAMFESQGTWDDVLIERNRLIGGGYSLYAGGSDATNTRVLNNTFSGWTYGPYTDWNSEGVGNVWSGNTV